MKFAVCILALLLAGCMAHVPGSIRISPDIYVRPNGMLDIGDITADVYHFNMAWTISEQHDVFKPQAPHNGRLFVGPFPTASGLFTLTERVAPVAGGIHYWASMSAATPVPTREMSVSFSLPVKSYGGKQIIADGSPITLPLAPAKQGQERLVEQADAHQIQIPTSYGKLVLTGDFGFLLQDDRQFGDPRYALRLHFWPSEGQITQSDIDFIAMFQRQ